MENSPSITSSGYHSDELHASETVGVNGGNSPPRVLGPASPSLSTSSVSGYDATRYQDETLSEATLPSVRVLFTKLRGLRRRGGVVKGTQIFLCMRRGPKFFLILCRVAPLFSHAQKYLTTFKLHRVYSN